MKPKVKLIFGAAVVLTAVCIFASCKKDDASSAGIVGTWKGTDSSSYEAAGGTVIWTDEYTFKFNADNTLTMHEVLSLGIGGYDPDPRNWDYTGTYDYNSQTGDITVNWYDADEEYEESQSGVVKGNTMTLYQSYTYSKGYLDYQKQ